MIPSGFEIRNSHGTSHISAADSTGLAFSLTTTVNLYFASKVMVPETGIILNNEMNDFSIPGTTNAFGYVASPANYIRAGKRSLSSIAPVIVEKMVDDDDDNKEKNEDEVGGRKRGKKTGKLYAVLGAAGGSRIITAVVQNVIDLLSSPFSSSSSSSSCTSSEHQNLSAVLARPRLHDQLLPNVLKVEEGDWDQDLDRHHDDNANHDGNNDSIMIRGLEAKGHKIEWTKRGYSACQGVVFHEAERGEGGGGGGGR